MSVMLRNPFTLGQALLIGLIGCLGACGQTRNFPRDADVEKQATDAGEEAAPKDAPGCEAAPTACSDPPPGFRDVAPIFERRCTECHDDAAGGPWPLVQYGDVAAWQVLIRDILMDCSKHPADVGVSVTPEERRAVLMWIACGSPP